MKTTSNISISPKQSDKYEIGAIMYAIWSCGSEVEVLYYCIVSTSEQTDWVTIRRMDKVQTADGEMPGDFKASFESNDFTSRKKLLRINGELAGFYFHNGATGHCKLWDGRPKRAIIE